MIPRLTDTPGLDPKVARWLERLHTSQFSGDIETSIAARLSVATDNSVYEMLPQVVVFPKSPNDVVALMQTLNTQESNEIQIVPRGGGTGTNGQALGPGVVVDLSRHMRQVGPIDIAQGCVQVEPGVVLDELNRAVLPHGVFFAPTLSPSDRATLGGMISTNACGKGSRIYGRTVDHIVELDVVLIDGTRTTMREMDIAAAHQNANRHDIIGHIFRTVLDVISTEKATIENFWPKMPRSPSGYNLRQLLAPDTSRFNLVPLVCGSEGTLGIVVGAKLKLTPIPKHKCLLVLRYANFDDALSSAEELLRANPSAIETIDENILRLVRTDSLWHRISHLLADDFSTRAINLVEFIGDDKVTLAHELQRLIDQLPAAGTRPGAPLGHFVPAAQEDVAAMWELRKKGVGLLGKMKGNRRPVPFVEDTAVPPARLSAYIHEFRELLDAEGLNYGMFGHVDVGCLHVRPALDMRDPDDEIRLRRISDKVAKLVRRYGGVLWGEHGTGFRSEYTPEFFGPRLYAALCRVKSAFDPTGKLNRGKIAIVPNRGHSLVSIDESHRAQLDRPIALLAQQHFSEAIFCNGNGQCFNTDPNVVMCPSSKITRDRIHSPKGRAALIKHWLRQLSAQGTEVAVALRMQQHPPDFAPSELLARWDRYGAQSPAYDYSHEVYAGLDGCLNCKACATQCPIEVDIPRMKAEFLSLYHERYPRPLRDFFIASLEPLLKAVGRFALALNYIFASRVFRWILNHWVGLMDLPQLGLTSVQKGYKLRKLDRFSPDLLSRLSDSEKSKTVLIVQDSFTTFFEPEVVLGVTDLLLMLGYRPVLVPFFFKWQGSSRQGFPEVIYRLGSQKFHDS